MHVGVGYCDHPDSAAAAAQAVAQALEKAKRQDPCDVVLLFGTGRHDQQELRGAVAAQVGSGVRIYGGGTVGVITNETFGYAGDQVGVACIWLDGVKLDALSTDFLPAGDEGAGSSMGQMMAAHGVQPETPAMLFYDAMGGAPGMRMATWFLAGMEKGLGFLPDGLVGAGLQGDHIATATAQYTDEGVKPHSATVLTFSDDIRIDSTIMHGCRPASQYYTVTKADGPTILEINGQPAITFMDELLQGAISPEEYPFFLLFGINHGPRWAEYDENNYASRLCLGIDPERGGIVMFEPDMVAGTEFQLMFRNMDLDYMKPKIEELFDQLDGREPVFAMYIDCAGRCAGYGGNDLEDAIVLQDTVRGRVPLLGLYTGVEIAPTGGKPRGLDWTGVFCLFSKGKGGEKSKPHAQAATWENAAQDDESREAPMEVLQRMAEQNAAKVLALDTQSIAIRHELEQKRRGFSLLADLSVSLRQATSYESLFVPVAQRINAALNMQKTCVLIPGGAKGQYTPSVLQGYSPEEKAQLAGLCITLPEEMLDPGQAVLVNGGDSPQRLQAVRDALRLPFFVSSPVLVQNEIAAVMVVGRMMEAPPFMSRLGNTDMETVQAVSMLLGSVLVHQRLEASEERSHIMLNAMPLCCVFWDEHGNLTDCNEEAMRLFGVDQKEEVLRRFYSLSPDVQPDGRASAEGARQVVLGAFLTGYAKLEWVFRTEQGELVPTEMTLVRVPRGEDYIVAGYMRDLREQKAALAEMRRARDLAEQNVRAKSEFLASVSHEIRTPLNAILAMTRAVSDLDTEGNTKTIVEQGTRSARLLASVIDGILDFSRLEAGQVELEKKPFSAGDVAEGVSSMLAQDAAAKQLSVRTEIAGNVPETVLGDAARLEQALFNITANAVKFTDEGEVCIRVTAERTALPETVRLVYAVQDTGAGLTQAQQDMLFKPLTALDTSYSRKQGGLGMGLAVSSSLARLMQGEITCESTPGEGSTFTLSVVMALPETAGDAKAAEPTSGMEGLAGMQVLVAEDNMINQMIVEEILLTAGVEVVTAGNGLEALAALEEHGPFDVVLMDIQMPEMDGLTAAAQIRKNPAYAQMPILAMTANSAEAHREESFRHGMNDHLTKPIEVDEVYDALRRWGKKDG